MAEPRIDHVVVGAGPEQRDRLVDQQKVGPANGVERGLEVIVLATVGITRPEIV